MTEFFKYNDVTYVLHNYYTTIYQNSQNSLILMNIPKTENAHKYKNTNKRDFKCIVNIQCNYILTFIKFIVTAKLSQNLSLVHLLLATIFNCSINLLFILLVTLTCEVILYKL